MKRCLMASLRYSIAQYTVDYISETAMDITLLIYLTDLAPGYQGILVNCI